MFLALKLLVSLPFPHFLPKWGPLFCGRGGGGGSILHSFPLLIFLSG